MANNHFLTSCYGYSAQESNSVNPLPTGGGTQGSLQSFPSAGTRFYPAEPSSVINGVTVNSVIVLLPTGLNNKPLKFYSVDTVTTLNTNAT